MSAVYTLTMNPSIDISTSVPRVLADLRAESQLAVVPGATHLFEEPGALKQVAGLAAGWFTRHLAAKPSRATA
jgi:hypothetical protein